MTATPAPKDLAEEFAKTLKLHDQLDSITTKTDEHMRTAIEAIRWYRSAKGNVTSSTEVDFGLVTMLCWEVELLIKNAD